MNAEVKPVVVQQSFDIAPSVVWKAITEREQMVQWFFDNIPDFRAEQGFATEFLVDAGERQFTHLWKITQVEPERKIVYDWRYAEYEGTGVVTFELSGEGNDCVLTVTCDGIESFTADIPEFSRTSCEGGWTYFIQGTLTDYLNR